MLGIPRLLAWQSEPDPGEDLSERRWPVVVCLLTVGLIIVCALAVGVARRYFDVDEIQHSHVMWLISQGDRPFHDFIETHPPFVSYLGAQLARRIAEPAKLVFLLRSLAALSGLAFVGLVLASIRASQPSIRLDWLLAAGLLVLSHKNNLDFFVEIRPDSITYCILFLGILLFLLDKPESAYLRYATFAFLVSTAILWTPKLALLVALFALVDLARVGRAGDNLVAVLAGHATGIGVALVGTVLALRAAGIDPSLAYKLTIGFHARFLSSAAFSSGLARSVWRQPVQLLLIAAGIAAWLYLVKKRRLRPTPLEIATLCTLVAMLVLIKLPYKQYFVPWFVLTTVFVPHLGDALRPFHNRAAQIALFGLLLLSAVNGYRALLDFASADQTRIFRARWRIMAQAAEPEGRVVAFPWQHPIFRRDVFYGWFSTFDPKGRDLEVIFQEWNPDGYGARFTREWYLEELENTPPAIAVRNDDGFRLPATQEEVLEEYFRNQADNYVTVDLLGGTDLLVRRDQANWDYLRSSGNLREE
jgi:hypothetical protein